MSIAGFGLALQGIGIAASLVASKKQSDALEDQATQVEDLSEEEERFIREQAELEADLIEVQGRDEIEVLAFNQGVALNNAAWEQRAGEVAVQQARKRWEAHIKSMVAGFAASGTRLTGTTNDVIMEQIGEMELDLFNLSLNSERAAGQQEDQARLFSLQADQINASAKRRAADRRRIGQLEAEASGTAAAARASAARTGASTARITGVGSAISGGASLLGDFAEFQDNQRKAA